MAALPDGWLDTGITHTFVGSLDVSVKATNQGGEAVSVMGIYLGQEPSGAPIDCGDWDSAATVSLYVRSALEPFSARTTVTSVSGACPQPYLTVSATFSIGPLRLGVTIDRNTGTDAETLTYRWFADASTVQEFSIAGGARTSTVTFPSETQLQPGEIGIDYIIHEIPFIGSVPADLPAGVRISNVVWDGVGNPNSPFDYAMSGVSFFGTPIDIAASAVPPLRYEVDVDVRDAAGNAPAGNVAAGTATVANPGTATVTDWAPASYTLAASLSGDWSSGGVTPYSADLAVPLRQIKPKDPDAAPESWTPATYEINSPVPVLLSSNLWVGSGPAVVAGDTFTVSGVGASVTRQLLSKWRNWNTLADPDYHADDGFTTTKHDYYGADGQDVWGWGLYSYLELDITAPATGNLTLSITWVLAGPPTAATYVRTYTVPVTSGTATYRIDLLFPAQGGPFFAERVDTLKLEGFQSGAYTLNSCELVADEDAYVKIHPGGGWPGIVISQDGQMVTAHWGTNPVLSGSDRRKDDESGAFQYDLFSDTSAGGSIRMDGTLEAVMDEWERMEGMTVTFNDATIDSDLSDGFGNVIGIDDGIFDVPTVHSARWYHTVLPHERAAPNATKNVAASIRCDSVSIPPAPAGTFVLPFRRHLGTVLESIVRTAAGSRAGAGVTVTAKRNATGIPGPGDTTMNSANTDDSGFVTIPIRNGLVSGSEFYVYMEA